MNQPPALTVGDTALPAGAHDTARALPEETALKIVVENSMFMNGGDAAIQIATKRILAAAFPDMQIVFCDSGYPAVAAYYPDFDIRPMVTSELARDLPMRAVYLVAKGRWYFRARRLYLAALVALARALRRAGLPMATRSMASLAPYFDADLVLSAGGTYLVSKYDITGRILEFQKDAACGLPLVLFTQSIEPFAKDVFSKALAPYLRNARLVLVRHAESMGNVAALSKCQDNIAVVADSVFALWEPGPTALADRRARAGRSAEAPLRIAVSVRYLGVFGARPPDTGRAMYHDAVRAAVTWLVRERGAQVTFLSTCQGIPEYWLDDSALAQDVADALPADVRSSVEIDRHFNRPEDLIETLKGFDGVIASRLHMAILSICANTPVLPVSYERKFQETFDDLGLGEIVTDVGEIDPETFPAACESWLDRLDEISARLNAHASEMRDSAMSAGTLIRTAMEVWTEDTARRMR